MIKDEIITSLKEKGRDYITGIIKTELYARIVANDFQREFEVIKERFSVLEQCKNGSFEREAINFIYWMQKDNRRILPPEKPCVKKASQIIPLLPYDAYDLHTIRQTNLVLFYPLLPGCHAQGTPLSKATAIRLAGILEKERWYTSAFVMYQGDPCHIQWVEDDGNCSINTSLGCYVVENLERILRKQAPRPMEQIPVMKVEKRQSVRMQKIYQDPFSGLLMYGKDHFNKEEGEENE